MVSRVASVRRGRFTSNSRAARLTGLMAKPTMTSPSPQRAGRKPSARQKLIAAAYQAMSADGLEGSAIADIIERAGVGVGSFYNHFRSKEALAEAVFADRAEELGATLENVALRSSNVATATCYAFRLVIEEVASDKIWAAFVVRLEPTLQMLDRLLRPHARVGIQAGLDRGELALDDVEAGITAFHAVMIAAAKAMLEGRMTSDQAHRSSFFCLRMFGIADDEAERLSKLSMTALRRELDLPN